MNKTLIKVLAVIGALAAAAALLYIFREKIALWIEDVKDRCSNKCSCNFTDFGDDVEEKVSAAKAKAEELEEDLFAD